MLSIFFSFLQRFNRRYFRSTALAVLELSSECIKIPFHFFILFFLSYGRKTRSTASSSRPILSNSGFTQNCRQNVLKYHKLHLLPQIANKPAGLGKKALLFFPLFGFFSFLHHFLQSWALFSSFFESVHLVSKFFKIGKVLFVYFWIYLF